MRLADRIIGAILLTATAAGVASAAPKTSESRPTKEGLDFFEKKIRPVLVHNCYECHSGDPKKAKANLVLDTHDGLRQGGDSGAVIAPGHADNSLLIEAIRYEGLEMPPKGRLPDEVIEDFVQWVEMGAPDPRVGKAAKPRNTIDLAEARKFWAFQRPKTSPPPSIADNRWPASNVDRFIRAGQEAKRLHPVPDADRATLIRRVTFDLTGLPPTPEEIDAFIQDSSAGAFTTVVDRLLASPRFGERWARHWLDVVRYAESTGKERDVPFRYAWRYRNYVIEAFNTDKPYTRFVVEQLAGDLLPAKNAAERDTLVIATGFLALGPKSVNTKNAEQFEFDVIDDQIDVTTRAMLGLTVACARCHDHKFDPIPTTDYYAMAGIFNSTKTLSGVAAGKKSASDKRLLSLASTKEHFDVSPDSIRDSDAHQKDIAEVQADIDRLRQLQKQTAKKPPPPKKGRRNQLSRPPAIAPAKVNPKQVREQIKKLEDRLDELEAFPTPPGNLAMGVRDANAPTNCQVRVRGELKDKGPEVQRGVLTVLKTAQAQKVNPHQSGRLDLAHWIADKDNPLTARVMVNRIWEHLFGQGLVDTVDNFGALGNEPSHPELLDALALQFMSQKWSVKKLIRSIVLSRTYQLSSQHNPANYEIDPANRFLWRMDRRRLDAEEIRDAMLAASGRIDLERPVGSLVLELGNGRVGGGKAVQQLRRPSNLRSIYLPILRGTVPDVLQAFDAADPSLIVGKRDVTTVPTQALLLMNNPFVIAQAEAMAQRILGQEGLNQSGRVDLAFRLALGRLPSETERSEVALYLNAYRRAVEGASPNMRPQVAAWASFCQALFESGEFRYVY